MRDIDTLLARHSAKPRRSLKKDFTQNIINKLDEQPHKPRFSFFKELRNMKLFTKPAVAVLAIVACVAIGGTSYAAVGGWSGIQALFGGEKKIDNARVVKVDTKNCTITSAFNVTLKDKKQDAYYYKVINGSKLTNEQIVQMVRGYCQVETSGSTNGAVQAELDKDPLNRGTIVGGYVDSTVTAITSSSISIESKIPVGENDVKTFNQTFNHIDPNVIVFQGDKRLTLGDVKVGDHVAVSYRASGDALRNSETLSPDKVSTDEQVIVAISKNTADFSASVNYQKYNGKEFEQVVPCASDASGYCNEAQVRSKDK